MGARTTSVAVRGLPCSSPALSHACTRTRALARAGPPPAGHHPSHSQAHSHHLQVQEALQSPHFIETLHAAVKLSAEQSARGIEAAFAMLSPPGADLAPTALAKIAPYVHKLGLNMLQPCGDLCESMAAIPEMGDLCAHVYARGPRSSGV